MSCLVHIPRVCLFQYTRLSIPSFDIKHDEISAKKHMYHNEFDTGCFGQIISTDNTDSKMAEPGHIVIERANTAISPISKEEKLFTLVSISGIGELCHKFPKMLVKKWCQVEVLEFFSLKIKV